MIAFHAELTKLSRVYMLFLSEKKNGDPVYVQYTKLCSFEYREEGIFGPSFQLL